MSPREELYMRRAELVAELAACAILHEDEACLRQTLDDIRAVDGLIEALL